jgi:DinB superfamily/Molydopterin dinucleotide binding domain
LSAACDEDLARAVLASGDPALAGITLERLRRDGWARLSVPTPFVPFADGFPTPSGKLEFVSPRMNEAGLDPVPTYTPPYEAAQCDTVLAARYPLALLAPASHYFLNSMFSNIPELEKRQGSPTIVLHPADAAARGLVAGDAARVHNARGEFRATVQATTTASRSPAPSDPLGGRTGASHRGLLQAGIEPVPSAHRSNRRGRRAPGRTIMATIEEYARQPLQERVERLGRTADELATAIKDSDEATLACRPDARNFAAKECVCHLRDTEEVFMSRFEAMLAMDNPEFMPVDPARNERWAEERQYLKNDVQQAIAHFRRRRAESLDFLRKLAAQLRRGGVHPAQGAITIDDQVTLMAWHDDNHMDQLRRALEGRA